jgi:hypothetical protein
MMPDTPKNQAVYPQNPAQKPGIGFPIARFVVVLSLATACVIDCAIAKYKGKETGETALLRQILGCFCKGDVAVADRFYGNYWLIALLMQSGVDVCCGRRLGQIGKCLVGKRPGRIEPRVRKKRGSDYNLMLQARQVLQAKLTSGDNSFETT